MSDSVGFWYRCMAAGCRRRIIRVLSARLPNIIDGGGGGGRRCGFESITYLPYPRPTLHHTRGTMYRHRLCCVDGCFAEGYYTPTRRQEKAVFVLQNIFGPRSRDATRHVTTSDERRSSPVSNPHSHYASTNTHA